MFLFVVVPFKSIVFLFRLAVQSLDGCREPSRALRVQQQQLHRHNMQSKRKVLLSLHSRNVQSAATTNGTPWRR